LIQVEDVRNGKTTFTDMAYKYILSSILSHELKPGQKLRVKDLATDMQLSITPVGRAVDRLAGEGFVEFKPGLGPYVSAPSVRDILELYDARTMCETYAIQAGIQLVDDSFLHQLANHIEAYKVSFAAMDGSLETRRQAAEIDRELHLHIVSLWPNDKVHTWYSQMNVHIKSFQLTRTSYQRREGALQEHRLIYEALVCRDVTGAIKALHQHGAGSKESFLLNVK
jgi:DNA-binding GntR family transcriptional regulator